jgi:two-component system, cell cycle sensor histidine kinase and response regulator CckA
LKTNLFYSSPAALALFGMTPDRQPEFDNVAECIVPEDRPLAREAMMKAIKDKEPYSICIRIIRKDNGESRYIQSTAEPEFDKDGKVIALIGVNQDISRQKQAEEALKASEIRYRELIDLAVDGILIGSPNGIIIGINQSMVQLFGLEKEHILGKHISELPFKPESLEQKPFRFDLVNDGHTISNERTIIRKDGEEIIVEMRSKRMPNGEYQSIFRDVTQRKQLEESLIEREEKFRMIAENVSDVITINDLEMNITYISPSIEKLRGYTPEEAMSQRLDEIVAPKSLERLNKLYAEQLAMEARGEGDPQRVLTIELEEYTKSGSVIWVELTAKIMRNEAGQAVGIISVARDISAHKKLEAELKASEEQFRALAENNLDIILRFDRNYRHLYANPAVEKLTGIPAENFIGKTHEELGFPPELCQLWEKGIQEVFDSGKAKKIEFTLGDDTWIDWIIISERNPAGEINAIMTTARDISQIKKDEIALRQKQKELEGAMQALQEAQERIVQSERLAAVGQLSAGLAHELNSHLSAILGFAELIQLKPGLTEAMRADLAHIQNAGKKAARLIKQLIDFSKKSPHKSENVDLRDSCSHFLEKLADLLPQSIALESQIAKEPLIYKTDPQQIQQLLENLSRNAIEAMPEGGRLSLSLEMENMEKALDCVICQQPFRGKFIKLSVRDTGKGIPADASSRIFEPFYTSKPIGQGSGLGLSQVYGIVSHHNGHITLESKINKGTTITIWLPTEAPEKNENKRENIHSGRWK